MATSSTFVSKNGDGYEQQMGRWSRRLAPQFVEFAGIAGAVNVLDVGCGTGSLSFCLAQNPEIVSVRGIDLSEPYVEHAKCRNKDARLAFQVGDACRLPYPDAAFDLTASMLALQFIPQCELAVREMRRVTRPGGTMAAATWDTRGGYVAYRMFFDTAAMCDPNGNERRARAYTRPMSRPGDLARAWRDAGLTDIEQGMLTIRMDYTCFADFWAPADGGDGPIAEYVRTLEADTRTKLKNMVGLAYLDGESDGARSYAATAWVVKGKVP
jgi:ubiquinone/menaquinone biosynthesis C-methylase UbiE